MSSPRLHPSLEVKEAVKTLRQDFGQEFPHSYFDRPDEEIPAGTFEFAVCFAGSVSAGAYLAGVADFLVEALDCWEAAKATAPGTVPSHNVRLSALAGTSGGGMTSLILASALNRTIKPRRADGSPAPDFAENPLYGAWVKGIDIKQLLSLGDLANAKVPVQSLLNSQRIADLAQAALSATGTPVTRSYVANPLHVGVTIGNLNGFAYQFGLRGPTDHGYSARVHEDVVRFAFAQPAPVPPSPGGLPALPNEQAVDLSARPTSPDLAAWAQPWRLVAQAAMGTGAFPGGLLPRDIERPWEQCDPRILPLSTGDNARVALLPALRGGALADQYSCLSVDGGTFNNEPFEVARTYLSGLVGSNKREGKENRRAVIMVDPLVEPSETEFDRARQEDHVFSYLGGLVTRAFVNQGRTHLREWTLAMADDIYSRYLLAPTRGDLSGEAALCGSALGAFGGFLCQSFREHDFQLGRRNCQRFLREHFALPITNPLFKGWREKEVLVKQFACSETKPDPANGGAALAEETHLPIIPLVGAAAMDEPEPKWPSPHDFEEVRDEVYGLLDKRLEAIYERFTADQNWLARRYLGLGWLFVKPTLLKQVKETIDKQLNEKGLY